MKWLRWRRWLRLYRWYRRVIHTPWITPGMTYEGRPVFPMVYRTRMTGERWTFPIAVEYERTLGKNNMPAFLIRHVIAPLRLLYMEQQNLL